MACRTLSQSLCDEYFELNVEGSSVIDMRKMKLSTCQENNRFSSHSGRHVESTGSKYSEWERLGNKVLISSRNKEVIERMLTLVHRGRVGVT